MKMFKIFFCIVMIMASTISAQAVDNLSKFKIKVTEQFKPQKDWYQLHWDKSFKLDLNDADSYFKMGSCLHVFEDKLLIVDNLGNKVNSYSKENGAFLSSFGHPGRGPGDVSHPIWLESYNNKIYLKSDNGLDVFDKNWKFEKRIRLFISPHLFSVIDDHIYFGFGGAYKNNYPLFIQMGLDGMVKTQVLNSDISDNFTKQAKVKVFTVAANDGFLVVPMHWNMLYIYDKNLKLVTKKKIGYSLLDKIEEWNAGNAINKKRPNFFWPCNLFQNVRGVDNKIYVFLNLPSRVEILRLDSEGNIETHFYNTDLPLMRWYGFDVEKKQNGQTVFYILANTLSDEDEDMLDFNVYRFVDKKSNISDVKIIKKK